MTQPNVPKIFRGLEGIYVDTTAICAIDGAKGTLSYRGTAIEELAQRPFWQVVALVLGGEGPENGRVDSPELTESPELAETLIEFMGAESALSAEALATLRTIRPEIHPMLVLQGMIPLLAAERTGTDTFGLEEQVGGEGLEGLRIAAKIPTVIAALHRLRTGQPVLAPKKGLSFHENFLYMFTGRNPSPEEVATLDTTQILQMEHGFNASTFAARVTASTLAPMASALSSAVGTLFGKLHGGADQAALEMVLEIGTPDKAEAFVLNALEHKVKIMGLGHRVYKVVDPRAKILKPMARALCASTPFEPLYQTFERVEDVMEREMAARGKQVKANVEFYKAPVFYALGFPPQYFTSLFVMGRIFGYIAHVLESRQDNRLIRPKAYYVGP